MGNSKMTMGLIVGNRGFFPDHLAKTGREEMIQVLQAAGMDVVVLGPEASKHGAVETHEEAKRCAELFRASAKNRRRNRFASKFWRRARYRRHAAPGPTRRPRPDSSDSGRSRENDHRAPPRLFLRKNVGLQQPEAIRYPVFHHLAAHRSSEFRRIQERSRMVRRGLPRRQRPSPHLRIGAIGARPSAFNTVRYSEKLLGAQWNLRRNAIDLSEVLGRIVA